MIVAVMLDSGLNPVFILGLGPGAAGSASPAGRLATLIANYTALIGAARLHLLASDLPLRLRGPRTALPDPRPRNPPKTIIAKGLPMGLQMIVISVSALAMLGLVNREGVDTDRRVRRRDAAVDLCPDAGDGARRRGQRDGGAEHRRRPCGTGSAGSRGSGIVQKLLITGVLVVVLTLADRPVLGAVPRRRQPGAADRPAYPGRRDLELPAVRGDDGPVRDGPRQRRGDGRR